MFAGRVGEAGMTWTDRLGSGGNDPCLHVSRSLAVHVLLRAHPHHRAYVDVYTHIHSRHSPTHLCDMSAAIWPPIGERALADEQAASQTRELEWLLVQLRETLQSLKAGLEECAALLAPSENGSTLVLSSVRSESLKGLITRIGTRITKGVGCCIVACKTHSQY
jgi:hypothetical protein